MHTAQKRVSLPCGQALHSAQSLFTFPCGQGLHSAQMLFTLPLGQGVHTAHLCFSLPCEHRLVTMPRLNFFAETPKRTSHGMRTARTVVPCPVARFPQSALAQAICKFEICPSHHSFLSSSDPHIAAHCSVADASRRSETLRGRSFGRTRVNV